MVLGQKIGTMKNEGVRKISEETCVMCSEIIPEGKMVCYNCEMKNRKEKNMVETKIKLDKIADIRDFIRMTSMCSGDVTVVSDKYIIDGKSIMGIFSLDLSKPFRVEFHGDIPNEVREGMQKYIVEE